MISDENKDDARTGVDATICKDNGIGVNDNVDSLSGVSSDYWYKAMMKASIDVNGKSIYDKWNRIIIW